MKVRLNEIKFKTQIGESDAHVTQAAHTLVLCNSSTWQF